MDGGLHALVHGRVGEDGLVVQQVALCIQAYHLAARPEAWVDAHHALLSQRCTQQQLSQVLRKHADGVAVGLLLAQAEELRLYRWLQQSLVAVFQGLGHQHAAGCLSIDIVARQALYALVIVYRVDAQAQDALGLAATHSQHAVAGAAFERLFPVEVVAVFRSLVAVGLRLHHLRGDDGRTAEEASDLLAALLVLADCLGDDILCATQAVRDGQTVSHEGACCLFRVAGALSHQYLRQRLQSLFAGHLCPGSASWLVGQVDVLQFRGIPAIVDALLQFGRHLLLTGYGLDDGLLTLADLFQPFVLVADGCYLYLVQSARAFLAIA